MKKISLFIFSVIACIAPHQTTFGAEYSIMAWGTQATELAAPYVNELRHACHAEPNICTQRSSPNAKIRLISIAFTQPEKAQANLERAVIFSEASRTSGIPGEISIDDFVSFTKKLKVDKKSTYLEQLIQASKSKNPDLQFGVTVYENELESIEKNTEVFSKEMLGKINRVALYLHFRKNGPAFASYVMRAKTIFPNARIFGGVYHYDRSDYIRCDQRSPGKCSAEQEISLYTETLQIQASLLKKKELSGLEFYPGFLGTEASWTAWSKGKACNRDRRSECIDSSQKMTAETLKILKTLAN